MVLVLLRKCLLLELMPKRTIYGLMLETLLKDAAHMLVLLTVDTISFIHSHRQIVTMMLVPLSLRCL